MFPYLNQQVSSAGGGVLAQWAIWELVEKGIHGRCCSSVCRSIKCKMEWEWQEPVQSSQKVDKREPTCVVTFLCQHDWAKGCSGNRYYIISVYVCECVFRIDYFDQCERAPSKLLGASIKQTNKKFKGEFCLWAGLFIFSCPFVVSFVFPGSQVLALDWLAKPDFACPACMVAECGSLKEFMNTMIVWANSC